LKELKVFVIGTRGFPNVQGGVEKHCQELYPRLIRYGCNITVFTRSPYIKREKRLKKWRNIKFIHLWTIRKKNFEAIVHTFLGVIIARSKAPDILHFHTIGPSILIPLAKILGMKVVMTNHGPDYKRQKWSKFAKKALRTGERLSVKYADKIIVISDEIKKLLENKYHRNDLELIPNGVNIPEIIPPAGTILKYDLNAKKYVLCVCRFVPEKGLDDLILAYEKIDNPDFKLVIVGDADHESEYCRKFKARAENTAGVVLTGILSGNSLAELFSNAGLFVLPSYFEGLPIALLEAMSYGLPVLASDIPQNKEILLPEYRYFKTGNIEDLAVKINKMIKIGIDGQEKNKLNKILKNHYNWDEISQRTFKLYTSI